MKFGEILKSKEAEGKEKIDPSDFSLFWVLEVDLPAETRNGRDMFGTFDRR